MQVYVDIRGWLGRKLEAGGASYVSICPQESARAYPQRAKVTCGEDPAAVVIDKVCAELDDIGQSRRNEGRPLVRVKLHVYGPKGAEDFGEHVFQVAPETDDGKANDGDGTREGETVALIREMRIAQGELVQAVTRTGAGGIELALKLVGENGRLAGELAEAKAALYVAEQGGGEGLVEKMLPAILPMVMQKMMAGNGTPSPG